MSLKIQSSNNPYLPSNIARLIMRFIAMLVSNCYFKVYCHGNVEQGPTLYVGLHRNGAVDGWLHLSALKRDVIFFVGKNLKTNPITRLFAIGIGLARAKDNTDTSGNREALAASNEWLQSGGALFMYPEGTSTLGPKPLNFHRGAAALAVGAIRKGIPLRVIPVGIDYESPATPGSNVDVIVGDAINLRV